MAENSHIGSNIKIKEYIMALKDFLHEIPESQDIQLGEMLEKAFEGKGNDSYVDSPEIINYSLKVTAREIREA